MDRDLHVIGMEMEIKERDRNGMGQVTQVSLGTGCNGTRFSSQNYGMGRNGMDFGEIIWDGMDWNREKWNGTGWKLKCRPMLTSSQK